MKSTWEHYEEWAVVMLEDDMAGMEWEQRFEYLKGVMNHMKGEDFTEYSSPVSAIELNDIYTIYKDNLPDIMDFLDFKQITFNEIKGYEIPAYCVWTVICSVAEEMYYEMDKELY